MDCRKLVLQALAKEGMPVHCPDDQLYFHVGKSSLLCCLSTLQSNAETAFVALTDCFAVDYLRQKNTFSVFYQLHSYTLDETVFVVTDVAENDRLPSITPIYENANWYEREIFDMFGLKFEGHPGLRRILCDSSTSGHLLRKDYSCA
ncbi:MAG: NADH-quinone oxidoreductase subunit C [Alphaproteobacteria bacterium]|nr:NADH-quinone oxidoreductase subunit C [Alphaproteobacteria bacterium]